MVWVFVAFAVLVILGAALLLTGRADPGTDQADDAPAALESPVTAEAVRSLRFRVGLRGYRMEDVDAALATIAADLAAAQPATGADVAGAAVPPDAEPEASVEEVSPDGGTAPAGDGAPGA